MLHEGTKDWYILAPEDSYNTNLHAKDWVTRVAEPAQRDGTKVFYCRQEAGDMLVVPRGWGHATINTKDVYGYACEMSYEP